MFFQVAAHDLIVYKISGSSLSPDLIYFLASYGLALSSG